MAKNSTYYQGDLRAELKNAALAIVESDGVAAVSLRSLARELGVSHAAPKNHFADKAALFGAIAVDGFDGLSHSLAGVAGDGGIAALLDAGVAYVQHALEHPAHFAIMWQTDLHRDAPEVAAARSRAYLTLAGLVAATDPVEPIEVTNRAWAVAHGWAALLLSGSLVPPSEVTALEYVRQQLAATPITAEPAP